jgi:hypothetical protein
MVWHLMQKYELSFMLTKWCDQRQEEMGSQARVGWVYAHLGMMTSTRNLRSFACFFLSFCLARTFKLWKFSTKKKARTVGFLKTMSEEVTIMLTTNWCSEYPVIAMQSCIYITNSVTIGLSLRFVSTWSYRCLVLKHMDDETVSSEADLVELSLFICSSIETETSAANYRMYVRVNMHADCSYSQISNEGHEGCMYWIISVTWAHRCCAYFVITASARWCFWLAFMFIALVTAL